MAQCYQRCITNKKISLKTDCSIFDKILFLDLCQHSFLGGGTGRYHFLEKFKFFVISQIRFCDIKTSPEICDITKSILMSQNALVVLYVKFSCVKLLNMSRENMTKLYVNN